MVATLLALKALLYWSIGLGARARICEISIVVIDASSASLPPESGLIGQSSGRHGGRQTVASVDGFLLRRRHTRGRRGFATAFALSGAATVAFRCVVVLVGILHEMI